MISGISGVGISDNKSKNVHFNANCKIARKEYYTLTDDMVRFFEEKTNKSFVKILATLTKRSTDEISSIFNIKNTKELDEDFKTIQLGFEFFQKGQKLNLSLFNTNKDSSFKALLSEFLRKNNFVNDENVFDKLPAKLVVLKKGSDFIDEKALDKFADKVVVHSGVEFVSDIKAKNIAMFDINNKSVGIEAENAFAKDVELKSINVDKNLIGKNLTLKELTSKNGGIEVFGSRNTIEQIKAKGRIVLKDIQAETIESTDDNIFLYGKNNRVKSIVANGNILGNNLKEVALIESKKGNIHIEPYNPDFHPYIPFEEHERYLALEHADKNKRNKINSVDIIKAPNGNIYAQNIKSKQMNADGFRGGYIVLSGKANKVNNISAYQKITAKNLTADSLIVSSDNGEIVLTNNNTIGNMYANYMEYSKDTVLKSKLSYKIKNWWDNLKK